MDGHNPKDIANGDKTRLSFICCLVKFYLKGIRCFGGKHKKRLAVYSVVLLVDKLKKTVVIGRAAKP
jgi:hypothetical protein